MDKIYTAMGLMSGTSSDGVDVSIIKSDGNQEFSILFWFWMGVYYFFKTAVLTVSFLYNLQ